MDGLSIHLVPVLFGSGTRLFEDIGARLTHLENLSATQTPRATHLRFRIPKPVKPWTLPISGHELPADVARWVVDANAYLTLATADHSGRPWATPVWYAALDCDEFFWVSRPDARHSRNLSATPRGRHRHLRLHGSRQRRCRRVRGSRGEEVNAEERAAAVAVYSRRAEARDIRGWRESDVAAPAPHRLYRARASRVYVLTDGDRRIPVT